jgi:hypothetical protein
MSDHEDYRPDPNDTYDVANWESMDEDREDDVERDCSHCGGDAWVECPDPIQCTYPHNRFGECPCAACGGSGLAKDQTIW